MTTPAAVAPSTNSFSISLARGGRSSAKTSTSEPTGDVVSSPDDHATSSSMESGPSGGSSFHSVLHHLYSSQNDSQSDGGGTQDASRKDKKAKDTSARTAAVLNYAAPEDGAQLRKPPSILQTLTGSSANTEGQTASQNSDPDAADRSTSASADYAAKALSTGVSSLDLSSDKTAGSLPAMPAISTMLSDPKQVSQAKAKGSIASRDMEPVMVPHVAKAASAAKPESYTSASDSAVKTKKTRDSAAIKSPSTPAASLSVDESNFREVLDRISSSTPKTTDSLGSQDQDVDRAARDLQPSEDARVTVSTISLSLPVPVKETRSEDQPVETSQTAQDTTTPDPTMPNAPAPDAMTTATLITPEIAIEPPPVPAQQAKASDSTPPARANVSLPPLSLPPLSLPPLEMHANPRVSASSGELAFAARLTPNENSSENRDTRQDSGAIDTKLQATPVSDRSPGVEFSIPDNSNSRSQDNQAQHSDNQHSQVPPPAPDGNDSKVPSSPVPPRTSSATSQASTDSSTPADRGRTVSAADQLVKTEVNTSTPQPVAPTTSQAGPAISPRGESASPNPSPAARMEQVIEMPAAPPSSNRDITVRVPDATERGTDIRFQERGGEVRVMVRTSDSDMAQTLRGGLGEFVGRMEHTGIRTEVWRPGHDAPPSQGDSQHQAFEHKGDQRGDSRGSGSGRNQQGSQNQENSRHGADKPRWVEELETSLAQPTSPAIQ